MRMGPRQENGHAGTNDGVGRAYGAAESRGRASGGGYQLERMKAEVKAEAEAEKEAMYAKMAAMEQQQAALMALIAQGPPAVQTTPAKPQYVKPNGGKKETLEQMVARLQAENEALKAAKAKAATITVRASEKGGVSVYGLGRFPVTLYQEQWQKLATAMPGILTFIKENQDKLKVKGE